MVFKRVRRIGRVFAVVLLVWTAADVLDYGACPTHGHLPAAVAGPAGVSALAPVAGSGAGLPGPMDGHAGDCFCCSPYVDVRAPFEVPLVCAFTWVLPQVSPDAPSVSPSRLYHPPLA